ncbi:MAG: hypothetical protein H0T89_02940 [Deltaproteobacteria bacterium]|nr:hypothetical protein [Deltaproteobacteria bacterium]MDQ3300532.1 hypothetical protein [Myxococcota bacterium]
MIESFVDLTYRGLPLGRRIKLTQVRPSTGYLEMPTPMPVGTQIAIATDDGPALDAVVTQIYEQVGGSDRVPGMIVRPAITDEAAATWWKARVALPEATVATAPQRAKPLTVRPRSHTVPQPPQSEAPTTTPLTTEVTATKELSVYVAETLTTEVTATKELSVYVAEMPAAAPAPESGKRTMVMDAVHQDLLAELTASDSGGLEHLVRSTGEHDVVDDGKRTMIMDAVDPATLGLEGLTAGASGPQRAISQSDVTDDEPEGNGDKPKGTPPSGVPSGVKKRKKKR